MDIKERNKFCGLLMFNTFSVSNKGPGSSNDFIMNNYDANSFSDQPEPYYKSRNDPQETSIAAGAAAPGGEENGKLSGCQKVQTEKRPPRPPNAFILYRRDKQPAILAANRHLTNAEISRYIADLWRNESNETRLKWERFADQTKLEHMKAYPNYVYRPNKNKGKRRQGRRQPAAASTDGSVEHQTSPVMNQQEGSTAGPIRPSTRGQNRVNMVGRRLELENQTVKMNAAADFQSMIPAATPTPPLEPASANAVRFDPLNIEFADTNVSTEELQISTPITPVTAQQHLIEIESLGRWKVVPTQPEIVDNRDNMLFPSSQIYSTFHEQTVDPSMLFFDNHNNHDTTPTLYDPSAYPQNSTNTSSLKATNDSVTGAGFSEFRDNPAVHNPVIAEILAFGEYFGGSANHLY